MIPDAEHRISDGKHPPPRAATPAFPTIAPRLPNNAGPTGLGQSPPRRRLRRKLAA